MPESLNKNKSVKKTEKTAKTAKSASKRQTVSPKSVIFVCTGNTCRSPMAEAIFTAFLKRKRKLKKYSVSSAGLSAEEGAPVTENALKALKKLNSQFLRPHYSRSLTYEEAVDAYLIVCMTSSHKRALASLGEKVKTVGELTGGPDVPDPYGQNEEVYLKTAEYLSYACTDILNYLEKSQAKG